MNLILKLLYYSIQISIIMFKKKSLNNISAILGYWIWRYVKWCGL